MAFQKAVAVCLEHYGSGRILNCRDAWLNSYGLSFATFIGESMLPGPILVLKLPISGTLVRIGTCFREYIRREVLD